MLFVGLTGGAGSGKSTLARLLGELGAVVIDADLLAREVVAPGSEGLNRVVREFGPDVLGPDGALDRAALAALVFADRERLEALNAIVHPLVRTRTAELTAAAPPDAVVVNDIPLLVENRMGPAYDVVVVVDVPEAVQVERLVGRGMGEADARARLAAQATRAERLAVADILVDNSGAEPDLRERAGALWADLRGR